MEQSVSIKERLARSLKFSCISRELKGPYTASDIKCHKRRGEA
jgi:hypothetical protein